MFPWSQTGQYTEDEKKKFQEVIYRTQSLPQLNYFRSPYPTPTPSAIIIPKKSMFKKYNKRTTKYKIRTRKLYLSKEIKVFDTFSNSTADYNGALASLTNIPQGDDFVERTGRRIVTKSLQVTINWLMATAAVATTCRFMIIQDLDMQDSGSLPSVANVLQNSGAATVIVSLRNRDPLYLKRFKVLYDKCVTLSKTGGQGATMKYYKKIAFPITFSGTAAADSAQNTLMFLVCSNEVTSNLPGYSIATRLRYTD